MNRSITRTLVETVCVWVVLFQFAQAQDVEASKAEAKAPSRVVVSQQPAATARFSQQISNLKEQYLGLHHRPTPFKAVPAALMNAAAPAPEHPTSVRVLDAAGPQLVQGIQFFANTPIPDSATNNDTSTVCEPTVAVRGKEILFTANWFAAFSRDSGATFSYRNPYTTFPASSFGPFCCDQVAIYDRKHDLMIWLLQYVNNSQGNIFRIAVSQGNDIPTETWYYYDFSPSAVGNWNQEWFDYPELALGEKYLYVTSNVFSATAGSFTRAVILRLPLSELSQHQAFSYNYYATQEVGSIRPAQGGGTVLYCGAHLSGASIRTLTWPEDSGNVSVKDVNVQTWSNAVRVAPGPDGRDWLGRADGRITAAWLSGDKIGFGWTAAQDAQFAYPHVRIAILKRDTKDVVAQPHVWNPNFAFAYPAASPNSNGVVGVSMHYGGNFLYPTHIVGTIVPTSTAPNWSWDLMETSRSDFGPTENRWGDYQSVRPHGTNPATWVASGYTLQGGPDRTNIVPRYIHFQRGGTGPAASAQTTVTQQQPLTEEQLYNRLLFTVKERAQAASKSSGAEQD